MKIAILGFSREGQSALNFLQKQKKAFGKPQKEIEYWILDQNQKLKIPRGVKSKTGTNYLKHLEDFDYIIRSPGIPYEKKELHEARKRGVQITSATALFFEHCPAKIIGITGTKGKGTTATILYRILKAANKDVFLVGNIGTSALNLLTHIKKSSVVVFELSSFQLQDLHASPHIAIVLGIAPDHLDSHKNFEEYVRAKSSIAAFQKKTDLVFYDGQNKWSRWIAKKSSAKKISIRSNSLPNIHLSDLYLPGPHLLKNAMFAGVVAKKLGISETVIKKIIREFRGNEHRLEYVTTKNTISFYNDSAATNPISTEAALRALKQPLILIAGGKNKGFTYAQLGKAIDHSSATKVILIGSNKKEMARTIHRRPITFAKTLPEAIQKAYRAARKNSTILFSPAAASFDMFQSYAERGKIFKSIVRNLK